MQHGLNDDTNIVSGYDLVPQCNNPVPEPTLTKIVDQYGV